MFTLSAFADEIDPDPQVQIDILKSCGVRHVEFRSIHKTNVLALSNEQVREFKKLLDGEGFKLSAIGSPVGKYPVDAAWEPHFDLFKRAVELAHRFQAPRIRVFSFYPPEQDFTDWGPHRNAVLDKLERLVEHAVASKVTLFHENEHKIYGDVPDRVADILNSLKSPAFQGAGLIDLMRTILSV